MNQLSPGPHDSQPTGPDTTAGTATPAGGNAAASKAHSGTTKDSSAAPATYEAVAGPFTIRDLSVFGSTLLMFVASLLPMFGERYNLWNLGNLFFLLLGIILPVVVTALFVARRLQPKTIVRVGSLSVDQFASVTASFAFPLFFLTIANSFNGSVLLGLIGSVGLLAATVLGPHLPWLSADFKGRAETPAHIVAREAVVPSRKPAAPKAPKAPKPAATSSTPGFQGSAPGYQAPSPVVSSGAPGAAAGSSPFAPAAPAEAKAAQATAAEANPAQVAAAPATAAPAVVHSADGTPGTAPAPSGATAAPATPAAQEATRNGSAASSEVDKAQASAPEPATTQHATQPAAGQPAANAQAAAQQPAAQQPWAATMATPIVSGDTRRVSDSIGATVDPASRPEESDSPAYEAFWFAVAQPRTAYDEHSGAPSFTIEPGGWVLALEDRGHEFLVQDTDGKVGVLRELSNIERG
ncbi:hypothetical protein [Paenarthrobacter nitroguajacolicus]|uniref:hypothetical protein n=1 Tax=Paenarthrobacter nitroguajacolicus TaxID=211146 RepID=UPI00285B98B3|nr:hypothetical protein [Paenarthrobacter nitroguajacolicus]MDR6639986.1 hypothetical protein [Paenarthrobacter nitroguajacolicus]